MFMRDIIREEFRKVLLESKISKRESTSRKILRRNSLEKNGEEMTKSESDLELKKIKSLIPNSSNNQSLECLYLPSVTRMYCNSELEDPDIIQKVNSIIGYLCKNNIVEDLEKITAQGLIDKYDEVVTDVNKTDNSTAETKAKNSKGTKGYTIKKITSFKQAKKYSKYVDWCVTTSDIAFKENTKNGTLPFFFCLKGGYDTIQRPEEETGNPKDEYGLSMIAIVFNGDVIHRATTRWNHDNGGNDNMFTISELVDVVGGDILKCKNGVISMLNKFYNGIEKELKSGKSLNDVFDSVKEYENINICELDDQYYIFNKKNEFIYKKSFHWCGNFINGICKIVIDDKINFIKVNGEFLLNKWFDWCGDFSEGFCAVKKGDNWNYINKNSEFLSNKWFDHCYEFRDGFGKVEKDDKSNFINLNGEILSNEWFDWCDSFREGFGVVEKDGKYNFIDKNGKILSNEWFDECFGFDKGVSVIKKENKYNYINTNGGLLSSKWFDYCWYFENGFGKVLDNDLDCYIDKNGKLYDENKTPIQENKSIDLMKRMMLM